MEHKTVKIASGLANGADKFVHRREFGYKSRSEFVSEAVRAHIRRLEAERGQPPAS